MKTTRYPELWEVEKDLKEFHEKNPRIHVHLDDKNYLTPEELEEKIGAIEGIRLRHTNKNGLAVYVALGGKEIEIIRDQGSNIDHLITRNGLSGVLKRKIED